MYFSSGRLDAHDVPVGSGLGTRRGMRRESRRRFRRAPPAGRPGEYRRLLPVRGKARTCDSQLRRRAGNSRLAGHAEKKLTF